jgi:hypothetical protein
MDNKQKENSKKNFYYKITSIIQTYFLSADTFNFSL